MQSDFFSRKLLKKYYPLLSPSQSGVVDNREQANLIR